MPGFDSLVELLTHPSVMPAWTQALNRRGPSPEDQLRQLQEQLDRIETQTRPARQRRRARAAASDRSASDGRPFAVATLTIADAGPAAPSLPAVRDQVVAVAGSLKEALRFAREDGITHPEAQVRLRDVQRWLDQLPALERFDLAPERLANLSPPEREAWTAILPTVRRLRQAGLNSLGTVEGLEETAAIAGTLGTQLQVATTALGATGPGWTAPPSPSVPTPSDEAPDGPYSRYAPEMSRSTGCVECGRGHLTAVAAVLGAAAEAADAQGPAAPEVAARLSFAQEELAALFQYDWTDDKLAKNPPHEQAALQAFRPQVRDLWDQARTATTPEQIRAVAAQARQLRDAYTQTLPVGGSPQVFASIVRAGTQPVPGADSVRVRPERVYQLHGPTDSAIVDTTNPVDPGRAFDRLAAALEACGTPVRIRQLPSSDKYILEGQYDPTTESIALAPAALARDPYAVQTLVHEAAHALLHGPVCLPHPPADHQAQEQQAEDVVIATMIQAGLPMETREGRTIDPGTRVVDWTALESLWGPDTSQNLRWASGWLTQVLDGAPGQLPTCQTCPVPQKEANQ